MIAHLVTFVWNATATEERIAGLAASLRAYVSGLDGVESYVCGSDLGIRPGGSDFGIIATFRDVDAFLAYAQGEEHLRIINEEIMPMQESRTSLQIPA